MNDLYVTKRTKFHWKDLKHVTKFVDNLTEIAQRMNAGFWMGLIIRQLCAQNAGTKSYFYVDAHKLYTSSTICYNWFLFYISIEIAHCSYSWIDFPAWSNYTCVC